MLQYKIVKLGEKQINDALIKLMDEVQTAIGQGWEPLGGVSVTSSGELGRDLVFVACQAMTKTS